MKNTIPNKEGLKRLVNEPIIIEYQSFDSMHIMTLNLDAVAKK